MSCKSASLELGISKFKTPFAMKFTGKAGEITFSQPNLLYKVFVKISRRERTM